VGHSLYSVVNKCIKELVTFQQGRTITQAARRWLSTAKPQIQTPMISREIHGEKGALEQAYFSRFSSGFLC
jgi:hypothetical protein